MDDRTKDSIQEADEMADFYVQQTKEALAREEAEKNLPVPKCSDCDHFKLGTSRKYALCKRADSDINMSLIDGGPPIKEENLLYCFIERDPKFKGASNTCGPEGKYFVLEKAPF